LFCLTRQNNLTETQSVHLVPKSDYDAWKSTVPQEKLEIFKEVGCDLSKWPGAKCFPNFSDDKNICVAMYDDSCAASKISFSALWPGILKNKKQFLEFSMHDGKQIPREVANRLAYSWATHNYMGLSVFKKARKSGEKPKARLIWPDTSEKEEVIGLATSESLFRNLVDSPAMTVGPAELGQAVVDVAKEFGCEPKVVVGVEDLCRAGYPQVAAVGMAAGSGREPRVVEFEWGSDNENAREVVVIIGKGITFDTGGLNIKGPSMKGMKRDMGGAGLALALSRLIMHNKLNCSLRTIIPIAENAINGEALRPSDVIRSRTGKTTEITNTDAEGRLVLADCLAAASEQPLDVSFGLDKRRIIINFATLTGAARVALGAELPALFSNDHEAMMELFRLSHSPVDSDSFDGIDPVWPLPLWEPMRKDLKSPIADIVNAPGTGGGAITAALYLSEFVTPLTTPASQETAYLAGKNGGEDEGKKRDDKDSDEDEDEDEGEDEGKNRGDGGGEGQKDSGKLAPIWFHLDFPGAKPSGMRAVYSYLKRTL
jgi:leucyl aminopeptidase